MSLSRSIIFGVVPDAMSEWKPEMAPQAMVMNTNGNTLPGMIGPLPCTNSEIASILNRGFTIMMPTTSMAIVPSFMYADR